MTTINAQGLSRCTSTAFGQGSIDHNAAGVAVGVGVGFGHSSLEHGGFGLAAAAAVGLGHLVKLVKATFIQATTSTRIRFTFDRGMRNNAALLAPFNYPIVPITPGAATVSSNEVEPQNVTNPTFVDVITSEMTDGATYNGTVLTTGPVDPEGTPMDGVYNSRNFIGIGIPPGIFKIEPVGENRVDVVFDEPMLDNADIRNSTKYVWDNGLLTLNVLDVLDDGIVQLVTSDQMPGVLYTLTVTP